MVFTRSINGKAITDEDFKILRRCTPIAEEIFNSVVARLEETAEDETNVPKTQPLAIAVS